MLIKVFLTALFLQILLYLVPETDVPVYSYLGSSLAKYVWHINRIMVSNIKSLPLQTKYTVKRSWPFSRPQPGCH